MDSPGLSPSRVRLAALLTPKSDLTVEEFHNHWLNTHSKLFSSLAIVKKNLITYQQVIVSHTVACMNVMVFLLMYIPSL